MNGINHIDQDALSDEVSDEAVEVAGTRTENAGAWTWVCTGIGCNYVETPRPEGGPTTG